MKDNSKHTVILYLHYLGRLKNLITNNTLVTTKKTPETSMADHKEDNKHKKTNWMNLFPVS